MLQPLLDVLLFTHSLSKVMGYKGQLGLYAYYVFVAWLLRAIAPPLASMTAQESALVGAFRCAARNSSLILRQHTVSAAQQQGTMVCRKARCSV
jgi:hypothetical protein